MGGGRDRAVCPMLVCVRCQLAGKAAYKSALMLPGRLASILRLSCPPHTVAHTHMRTTRNLIHRDLHAISRHGCPPRLRPPMLYHTQCQHTHTQAHRRRVPALTAPAHTHTHTRTFPGLPGLLPRLLPPILHHSSQRTSGPIRAGCELRNLAKRPGRRSPAVTATQGS